jgi:hypothetical protein
VNRDAHLARSSSNEQLFHAFLDIKSGHREWAVTILFYAALHALDVYLHEAGYLDNDIANHHDRLAVARDALPRNIFSAYNALYIESRHARYDRPPQLSTTEASFAKFAGSWSRVLKPFLLGD